MFITAGHHVFFDGEGSKAGYFWLAPIGHDWSIFEKVEIDPSDPERNITNVAGEIKETKPFKKLWELKSPHKDNSFAKRIVDFKNQRLYVVERPKIDERNIFDTIKDHEERRKYFDAHDLVCYDFQQNRLWSRPFYNYLFSIYLSPDAENLFIGIPLKVNVSYEPGFIVILNKNGDEEGKIKAPAHGFELDFVSNDEAIINFVVDRGEESKIYQFGKDKNGKWKLGGAKKQRILY